MAKKAKTKSEKLASPEKKRGRVAGREVDLTPVAFEKGKTEDFELGSRVRESSKYHDLIMAAIDLEDGECVHVGIGDGDNPDNKRLNIAQAIHQKAKPQIEKGYRLRVRLNNDRDTIVVSCEAVEED